MNASIAKLKAAFPHGEYRPSSAPQVEDPFFRIDQDVYVQCGFPEDAAAYFIAIRVAGGLHQYKPSRANVEDAIADALAYEPRQMPADYYVAENVTPEEVAEYERSVRAGDKPPTSAMDAIQKLVTDLGWDSQRMSSSGIETLGKLEAAVADFRLANPDA